jgi:hypothetical protein
MLPDERAFFTTHPTAEIPCLLPTVVCAFSPFFAFRMGNKRKIGYKEGKTSYKQLSLCYTIIAGGVYQKQRSRRYAYTGRR